MLALRDLFSFHKVQNINIKDFSGNTDCKIKFRVGT